MTLQKAKRKVGKENRQKTHRTERKLTIPKRANASPKWWSKK